DVGVRPAVQLPYSSSTDLTHQPLPEPSSRTSSESGASVPSVVLPAIGTGYLQPGRYQMRSLLKSLARESCALPCTRSATPASASVVRSSLLYIGHTTARALASFPSCTASMNRSAAMRHDLMPVGGGGSS